SDDAWGGPAPIWSWPLGWTVSAWTRWCSSRDSTTSGVRRRTTRRRSARGGWGRWERTRRRWRRGCGPRRSRPACWRRWTTGRPQVLGGDALPLLRQAQARHPQDFWLNFALADFLLRKRKVPGEAVGFYWAALVIRPDTATVYNNLGAALHDQKDLKGAIAAF